MKCIRTFHAQLKEALPEPATDVCPSLKPGDWVYVKVYHQKHALEPHWKGSLSGTVNYQYCGKVQGPAQLDLYFPV